MAGAPLGNRNSAKGTSWNDALRRAIARAKDSNDRDALDQAADKLVAAAMKGDEWAIKELGNRIDGKSIQGVIDYTPPPVNPPVLLIGFELGGPGQQTAQSEDDAAGPCPESP